MTRIGVNEFDEALTSALTWCTDGKGIMRTYSGKLCLTGLFGAITRPVSCSRFRDPIGYALPSVTRRARKWLGHLEEFG